MQDKRLSLPREVSTLSDAVEAGRLLADQLAFEAWVDERGRALAPQALSSLLAVVACRLRLVRAVLAEELPSSLLLAPHNEVARGEDLARGLTLGCDEQAALAQLQHALHALQDRRGDGNPER